MIITKKRKLTKEQLDILKAFVYDVWVQIGNTGEEERYPLITFNKKPLSKEGYIGYDDEDWELVYDFVSAFAESDGEYTITYEDDSDEDDDEDEEDY